MMSYQRRCDVITSHRRWYDVILTLCAHWDRRWYDVILTLCAHWDRRWYDVILTLCAHWDRRYDVILTLCAHWDVPSDVSNQPLHLIRFHWVFNRLVMIQIFIRRIDARVFAQHTCPKGTFAGAFDLSKLISETKSYYINSKYSDM